MTCDTDMWHVTGDMWQVTRDRWQVTPDTWHIYKLNKSNIETYILDFQPASILLDQPESQKQGEEAGGEEGEHGCQTWHAGLAAFWK